MTRGAILGLNTHKYIIVAIVAYFYIAGVCKPTFEKLYASFSKCPIEFWLASVVKELITF
jgi:hypothetical protein